MREQKKLTCSPFMKMTLLVTLTGALAALGGCRSLDALETGLFTDTSELSPRQAQETMTNLQAGATSGDVTRSAFAPQPQQRMTDEIFGDGPTSVAMLLPLSSSGEIGALARDLRNAVELAVSESAGRGITVVIKDTCGVPKAAAEATEEAIAHGAQVIIGPMLQKTMATTVPVARRAGVPVLGFSSDTRIAGGDVFLMPLLPQDSIDRILRYAHARGARSFAAVLPTNRYGELAQEQMRRTLEQVDGSLVAVASYNKSRQSMTATATQVARQVLASGGVDAILIPDVARNAAVVATALRSAGINPEHTRILGSGQWTGSPAAKSKPLSGAWYPAFASRGYQSFANRYQQMFGSVPRRNATFAYDAALLATAMTKDGKLIPNYRDILASPSGFSGIDGIFRLGPDGINERGLAVYRAATTGSRTISNAPTTFTGRIARR